MSVCVQHGGSPKAAASVAASKDSMIRTVRIEKPYVSSYPSQELNIILKSLNLKNTSAILALFYSLNLTPIQLLPLSGISDGSK